MIIKKLIFMSLSPSSSTLITTPPTLSPVNNKQVNNFFLSIEQFICTQGTDILLFYYVPYQQIAADETSPIQQYMLFDNLLAQLWSTLIRNLVVLADFDIFRENWALYLYL